MAGGAGLPAGPEPEEAAGARKRSRERRRSRGRDCVQPGELHLSVRGSVCVRADSSFNDIDQSLTLAVIKHSSTSNQHQSNELI